MAPLYADCLLRCASDLDGDMLTARDHVAVKTAMEERQARERGTSVQSRARHLETAKCVPIYITLYVALRKESDESTRHRAFTRPGQYAINRKKG